ncbi:MAG: MFS transporter [Chloroflexaceae bacterium]|jgi:FSR family fosmidomycin resistance protein-like MFS transporter|nr:MFS transporter [Chloroflexaceae bacterium]
MLFRNRLYLGMISGHFTVDLLNGMGAVLLAVLTVPLGLSNAQIGLALTLYTFAGSLSQPLWGLLSDRLAGRMALLAALGMGWMAAFYAALALAPSWGVLLPLFLLASLGSGLFHPVGTATAGSAVPEQAGRATAIFFFCGQIGLALGPVLAGLLLRSVGTVGILPLAALTLLPLGLLLAQTGEPRNAEPQSRRAAAFHTNDVGLPAAVSGLRSPVKKVRFSSVAFWLIAAFIMLVAVRSSIQATYQAFLPKLFADRGFDPAVYGVIAGLFMGAAAFGNIITGDVADRYGMRAATVWPLLFSVPVGLLCLLAPSLPLILLGSALAGLTVGGQHSVLVVHAQRLLPAKQGFAAGLILGFTFAIGAVGTWLVGHYADRYTLLWMMELVTWLGLPCALLALTLPGRPRPVAALASEPAPSAD